ncbi:MAG: prohibitin family protein [Microcystaceae cyanobacterium]
MQDYKLIAKLAIPLIILGFVSVILKTLAYVTPPGHATVIFNTLSGLQMDRVEKPGVTLINPAVDRPITYNIRTKVWGFTNESSANKAGTAITVNSSDGQAFDMDVYIALRPNQDTLDDLHSQVGENYMNTVVVPVARSKIRDISAEYASKDFYLKEKRQLIEQKAVQLISQEMPTGQIQGETAPLITIEGVFLGTPNFPEALKKSIERKQVASITAQTASVRAEIQSKETERLLILAEADQKAIELKGQAAAANAQLADLLLFETLENRVRKSRTDPGVTPLKIIRIEGDSTVFLNVDPQKAVANQQAQK